MKEAVREINEQYRLGLSEDEIARIAQDVDEANALFRGLFIDEINGVTPLPIVSRTQGKR